MNLALLLKDLVKIHESIYGLKEIKDKVNEGIEDISGCLENRFREKVKKVLYGESLSSNNNCASEEDIKIASYFNDDDKNHERNRRILVNIVDSIYDDEKLKIISNLFSLSSNHKQWPKYRQKRTKVI